MDERRAYPFRLDADTLVELISTCWRAHDGQWFLKAADRVGLEDAMRLNEGYPPCQRAWGARSARYRFTVTREPLDVRRSPRAAAEGPGS